MTIQSVTRSLSAHKKLSKWYRESGANPHDQNNFFLTELRFIRDNRTKAQNRKWLCSRFPDMLGQF